MTTAPSTPRPLTWIDANGQPWSSRITLSHAERLKRNGVDILSEEFLKNLFGLPLQIIELLGEVSREQWEARGISYEQFADLVTQEEATYVAAKEALMAGLVDFFHRLTLPQLAALLDRGAAAARKITEAMVAKVNGGKVDTLMNSALKKSLDDFDRSIDAQIAEILGPG